MSYYLLVGGSQPSQNQPTIQLILPSNVGIAPVVQPAFVINPTIQVPQQNFLLQPLSSAVFICTEEPRETQSNVELRNSGEISQNASLTVKRFPSPPPIDPERYKKYLEESRALLIKGEIPINAYLWRVIKHRLQDGKIRCGICGVLVKGVYGIKTVRLKWPIGDHARRHLNKPGFTCRLCDASFVTFASIKHHIRFCHKSQSIAQNVTKKSKDFIEELVETIDQCFKEGKEVKISDDEMSIGEYCQRAIASRMEKRRIRCAICNDSVSVGDLRRLSHAVLIDHVLQHMSIDVYTCTLCPDHHAINRPSMRAHLKKKHGQRMLAENVLDKTSEHVNHIKAMIDRCFGRPEGLGESHFELPKESVKHRQKRKSRDLVQRARDLILKYSKSNRLECLLCSKSIQSMSSTTRKVIGRFVIDHASEHLGIPLYQCNYCQKSKTGLQPVIMHVMHCHGVSSKGAYVDRSYEHVDDLMQMLNQCFDPECQRGDQDGMEKFGLEESDDGSDCESLPGTSSEGGRRYNLRPRRQEASTKKRRGFRVAKSFLIRRPQTGIRYEYDDGTMYQCCLCAMSSRYQTLVEGHVRLMHGE